MQVAVPPRGKVPPAAVPDAAGLPGHAAQLQRLSGPNGWGRPTLPRMVVCDIDGTLLDNERAKEPGSPAVVSEFLPKPQTLLALQVRRPWQRVVVGPWDFVRMCTRGCCTCCGGERRCV